MYNINELMIIMNNGVDVDECAEHLDSCLTGLEICINDLGRYHCEPISAGSVDEDGSFCPPGYIYDEDERVCIG